MSKNKQARLISQLGSQMAESAGSNASLDDRYRGFTPSDAASGHIDLDRIIEDPDQPRKSFDDDALKGLAANIKVHGVQQPIQLRWSEPYGKWLIVYGHRRYRASKLAGLSSIPCSFIDETVDEPTIRVRQLIENCQREDLAPMEMAQGIEALAELAGWSNRKIGEELGLNHTTIGRYRSLLKLPDDVQQLVENRDLAPSVAAEIQKVASPAAQARLGKEISAAKLNRTDAQAHIATVTNSERKTPPAPKATELVGQTLNVAVYRNPNASPLKVKRELLSIVEQLDTERVET